jgi:tRNA A-37 threonylcarbamoyl transferase component Bud32
MAVFLNDPDETLDRLEGGLLKNGRGSTVGRVMVDGLGLVVKRYNIKGFWHGIRRCLRASRAARSWRNAHRLLLADIKTPVPVALVEKRFGPLRSTAYFINEFIDGPRAVDYFPNPNVVEKREVALRIADLLVKLKQAGISHGDMKATNIIISDQHPALVDLDAMRAHGNRWRFGWAHQKDVKRFFRNWQGLPEVDGLFREILDET